MPKGIRRGNYDQLTPEQKRSSEHIRDLEWQWRGRDRAARMDYAQSALAREISKCYQVPGRAISPSGYGKWKRGLNIPDYDSAVAIVAFFQPDDPEETYEAFGHHAILSFRSFYEKVKDAAKREQWEDEKQITRDLELSLELGWDDPDNQNDWFIRIARKEMNGDDDLHTRAGRIADIAVAYQHLAGIRRLHPTRLSGRTDQAL